MGMSGDAQIGSICVSVQYERRTAAGKQNGGDARASYFRAAA
jgi:hypothetical protein